MNRKFALIVILAALMWYGVLGLRHIDRPGLHYDECMFLAPHYDGTGRFAVGRVGEDGAVLVQTPSLGGIKFLLMDIFFRPFAFDVREIRYPALLFGLLSLVFAAFIAWRFFGPAEAMVCAWLLALDPSFLHHVREDFAPGAIALLLRTAVFAVLAAYYRSGRAYLLTVAGFLAGMGIWEQPNFIYFLAAALIAVAILWRKSISQIRFAEWRNTVLAFLFGTAPILLFWMLHPELIPFALGVGGATPTSLGLLYKLIAIFDTLRGVYPVRNFLGSESITVKRTLLPHLLIGGLLAWAWLRNKRKSEYDGDNAHAFFAVLFGLQTLILLFVPQANGSPHFFSLTPTAHILVAALLIYFIRHAFATTSARRWGTALLLLPVMITGAVASIDTEIVLDHRRGSGDWSPAISELAKAVSSETGRLERYTFLDWGMTTQVAALTGGMVYDEAFWELAASPASRITELSLAEKMRDPRTVFIARAAEKELFAAPMHSLIELMARDNYIFRDVQVINDTDDKPLYLLMKIEASN